MSSLRDPYLWYRKGSSVSSTSSLSPSFKHTQTLVSAHNSHTYPRSSSYSCMCACLVTQSCRTLWWTLVHQAPLSMVLFSKQEYWSGFPCPSPADLPDPGVKPASPVAPALAYRLSHLGSPLLLQLNMRKKEEGSNRHRQPRRPWIMPVITKGTERNLKSCFHC